MSKRQITGGSMDLKPQVLHANVTQATVNQFTTATINSPFPRVQSTGNKATIMEVLKVYFFFGAEDATDLLSDFLLLLSTTQVIANGTAATTANLATTRDDPHVLAVATQNQALATNGAYVQQNPIVFDLTDGAGNGALLATDQFFLTIATVGATTAITGSAKILYRLYSAGVMEYVGIVQSQQ